MNRIINFISQLFFKDTGSVNIDAIVNKSFRILVLQIVSVIIIFVGNVMVARWYGDEIYGLYSHLFNWFSLLSIIAVVGMDDYHIATLPALKIQKDHAAIQKVLKWSLVSIAIAAAAVMLLFNFIISTINIDGLSENHLVFKYAASLIFLFAIGNNLTSFLRGLDVIVKSQVAEKIIRPVIFVFVLVGWHSWNQSVLTIYQLISAVAISVLAGLFYEGILIRKELYRSSPAISNVTGHTLHFKKNRYFLAMSILYILTTRIDILVLGSLAPLAEVGYYNVALKIADIIAYPVVISNIVIPTFLSRYHFKNDKKEVLFLIRNGARGMFTGVVLLFIIALLTAKSFLNLYGENFYSSFLPLMILGVSQLITAFTGPVCAWFLVSGNERTATMCMLINVFVTGAGCFFLIPALGIAGAALANLAGSIAFNISLIIFFYRKEGVIITPLTRNESINSLVY